MEEEKQQPSDYDLIAPIDINNDGEVDTHETIQYVLHSRTIWVNALALLALHIQSKYGFVVDAALQMEILTIVNLILRAVTKKPLAVRDWKKVKSVRDIKWI